MKKKKILLSVLCASGIIVPSVALIATSCSTTSDSNSETQKPDTPVVEETLVITNNDVNSIKQVLETNVNKITNVNQEQDTKEKINTELSSLEFFVSNQVSINKISISFDLNKDPATAVVSLELTSEKKLKLESAGFFGLSGNVLISSPITTDIHKTVDPEPQPEPAPTPKPVEINNDTFKSINDLVSNLVSEMTSEEQANNTKELIKTQLQETPFFANNKITVSTVNMVAVKTETEVKYNVQILLECENKLTLVQNQYFSVNGNNIETKEPILTKIVVKPAPEPGPQPQPEPQPVPPTPQPEVDKNIVFSNDDVNLISSIFMKNLGSLDSKDKLDSTKQTILSELNKVGIIETNKISVNNLVFTEVNVENQVKYSVSFDLSVNPVKQMVVPNNDVFDIVNNKWTSKQALDTSIVITPPEPEPQPQPEPQPSPDNSNVPVSTKTPAQHVNINRLQGVNKLFPNDVNVSSVANNTFEPSTLASVDNHYPTYFNALSNNTPVEQAPHDTEWTGLTEINNVDIGKVMIENGVVKVLVSPDEGTTLNMTSCSLLVKGWDQYHPWSKRIDTTVKGNIVEFDSSLLGNVNTKFIITQMNINNNSLVNLNFNKQCVIDGVNAQTPLSVSTFKVYKDEAAKQVYGSLCFDWDTNTINWYKDKVFALTLEVFQNNDWKKPDIMGGYSNEEDNYNKEYQLENKRIYVPFSELSKFSLNGCEEQIKYTLKSVEVLNDLSYLECYSFDVKNSGLDFAYNFNWEDPSIQLKDQLYETVECKQYTKSDIKNISSSSTVDIPYSLNNFNTVLDYNFEVHNNNTRYKNALTKDKLAKKNIRLMKNGVPQQINFFQPREYLNDMVFKISEDKQHTSITKDLNAILGQSNIQEDDMILWLTFELDLNPRKALDWTELNDMVSRVRVPVNIGNLKKNKTINDVDFMFDYIAERPEFQQSLFSKIKSNVKFDISIDNNNQLTLNLSTRNNNIAFNDEVWMHNNSLTRSAYINNCYMFVNWIQPETTTDKLISFQQQKQLDQLSVLSNSVGYMNSYNIETVPQEQYEFEGHKFKTAEDRLSPVVSKEQSGRRLFEGDDSVGINSSRKRTFSLNNQSDGTWNLLGKVNDDPKDYRFYAITNYHVFKTSSEAPGYGTTTQDKRGRQTIENRNFDLKAPTLISKDINHKNPLYFIKPDVPEQQGFTALGNLFHWDVPEGTPGIKIQIFTNFWKQPSYDPMDAPRTNNGTKYSRAPDNQLDMIVGIVDFAPVFKEFEGKDLATYQFQNRSLDEREQKAIKHYLDFKDVPVLKISELGKYMSTFSNMNLYVGSYPISSVNGNPDSIPGARYREYILANNTIKLKRTYRDPLSTGVDKDTPTFELETRYFDLTSGSSGSGAYDVNGDIVAIDCQGGSQGRIANFIYFDTQKYSYMGNASTIYNPGTFYQRIKKISYLYPQTYKDIYSSKKR